MNKWTDYYKIVEIRLKSNNHHDNATSWLLDFNIKYQVQDPHGNVIGTYDDVGYAKKQAKYKFKRLLNRTEKLLLG